MAEYRPSARIAEILRWAKQELDAIPYDASSRWVFYQVVQKYGVGKDDYRKFLKWTSRARKSYYQGWAPDTLVDDTREITERGNGFRGFDDWRKALGRAECTLEVQRKQPKIVLVLFEAAAMRRQFDHYLAPLRISSAPFQGDASIGHKWKIAEQLTQLHKEHPTKPIVVLYFGDLDPKGLTIPRSAMRDIWQWMDAPKLGDTLRLVSDDGEMTEKWSNPQGTFSWIRIGLNRGQIPELDIPENPEKPGTYQWEALSDEQAREMILGAVAEHWDPKVVQKIEAEERRLTGRWKRMVDGLR